VRLNWKRLGGKIGFNWAIAYTVFARIIQAAGGVGSVLFIAKYLSKDEQGYYYTFGSILAIQIFFELGLGTVLTQYVAHEMVHLKWKGRFDTEGDVVHQSRLSSLLHFSLRWYTVVSILVFLTLNVAGFYFFSRFNPHPNIEWRLPWMILCLASSAYLVLDPLLAILEGLGKVKEIAKIRLVHQTVYIVGVITFLFSGCKLYSAPLATSLAFLVVLAMCLFSDHARILLNLSKIKGTWKVNYLKEIFPFQYKIALSWISGYFIFQLFNPILFATEGPVVAGQMGMTLAALNGISSLSMSWMSTKVPMFCSFVAQQAYDKLNYVFNKSLLQLIAVNLCLLLTFILFLQVLSFFQIPLAHRFLHTIPVIMLCAVTFINQLVFSWATYLRSHKQEPYLINSVVGAILVALSTIFLGRFYGLMGIVGGYTFLTTFIGLPWAYVTFRNKKQQWHTI
jgi:O-antigen/teichoic acid export membrane protein